MQTKGLHKGGSVQMNVLLQLFLSHLLVGICVIAGLGIGPAIIFLGAIVGVVLTLNLPFSLHLLELALHRLASALPLEPPALRWRWPLTPLFSSLNALGHPFDNLHQQATQYRDQLSLQMSKTTAQEERNRLARDLHDSIKQQIFSVVMSAAAAKVRWENDPASARRIIDDIERTAQEAQVEMQALLQELRPVALENVGLIESLRLQCQSLGYRTGAEVIAELSELPSEDLLPLGAQELIFRIVQESFANIARHARAKQVWLSLWQQQDALLVEIGDDGQGFALEERPKGYGGMGLANIRERTRTLGGKVSIWSRPGEGTTLHLYLPLIKKADTAHPEVEDEQAATAWKKARRSLNVGIKAVELVAALVLLYIPASIAFWFVGAGLLVALCVWFWSQRYRVQVALSMGPGSARHTVLQAESCALLAGIALALFAWIGYLNVDVFMSGGYPSLTAGAACVCFSALFAATAGYVYHTEHYHRQLSTETLHDMLGQKLRYLTVDFGVWTLVAALTFAFIHPHEFIHINLLYADGWTKGIGLLFLFCWLFANLLRLLQTLRWRWFVTRKAA